MKTNFPSPVATAEFSKFAGILSAAVSQHHLSGFEIAQLEIHHLCLLLLFFSQLLVRPPQTTILPFCTFFLGMVLITASCTFVHSSSGTLSIRSNPLNLFLTSICIILGICIILNGLVVFPTFFNLSLNLAIVHICFLLPIKLSQAIDM